MQEIFQSLCPSNRKIIHLDQSASFEYRPHYYEEVTCFHSHHPSNSLMLTANANNRVFSFIFLHFCLCLVWVAGLLILLETHQVIGSGNFDQKIFKCLILCNFGCRPRLKYSLKQIVRKSHSFGLSLEKSNTLFGQN